MSTVGRDPILRVMPEPQDINSNGHIFGGWVMSMMDRAGGIYASRLSGTRCATVAVEAMTFHAPILMGDLISLYASIERRGRTSLSVRLDVMAERGQTRGEEVQVTTGVFTFVALGEDLRPTPLPPER